MSKISTPAKPLPNSYSEAPFAVERDRYLQHCKECGTTPHSLSKKRKELARIARLLPADAPQGIDKNQLQAVARQRALGLSAVIEKQVMTVGRPWLRFLGWWREPVIDLPCQDQLDDYVRWMRDARGFSPSTVDQWQGRIKQFLRWCLNRQCPLNALQPSDVDAYFVQNASRWGRLSMKVMTGTLRVFLRYAADQGLCDARLASALRTPRVYTQESLPFAPSWADVQRLLATTETDKPADIRDRAILMLLAIYGMRSGEVAALRLEQVDWAGRTLHLFRLKRRQPQIYPLLPTVAEALARYIDTVRPPVAFSEIFISHYAPQRPLTPEALYSVVNTKFKALGIAPRHRGPHALRHACAVHLVTEGFHLKEIGDHLGHRTSSATMTYAKVNMAALREVGDFDLGDLP